MGDRSKVLRFDGYRWEMVPVTAYKPMPELFRDVTRQTLLGERDGEEPLNFLLRYFEVQPGGYSTLERHEHPHAVMVLRGEGEVTLGERVHAVRPHDCVYVAPGTPHRFRATGAEPLGFICIVDRQRDKGVPVE